MKTIKRNGKETVLINPCDIRNRRRLEKILISTKRRRRRVLVSVFKETPSVYDGVPDVLESAETMTGKEMANMLIETRKIFIQDGVESGRLDGEDPLIKGILEEKLYE